MTLQKFNTLQDAIELATFGHRKQQDRAGMPYLEHPMRVMRTVQEQGALPYVQMAAVLHDLTEDSLFTCDMLKALGVPEAAVELVRLVDRDHSKRIWNEGEVRKQRLIDSWADLGDNEFGIAMGNYTEKYGTFFDDADEFYYDRINANPEARMIKLADIGDNMQPWRRSYLSQESQDRLAAKYAKAYRLLGV